MRNKKLKISIYDRVNLKVNFHFGYLSSLKPFLKYIGMGSTRVFKNYQNLIKMST